MALTCCCGMRLRTGGLVVGYLSIVVAAIGTLIGAYYLLAKGAIPSTLPADERDALQLVFVMLLVGCVISLIVSILLVVGIHKDRHLMLLPYLIICGASLVITTISEILILPALLSDTAGIPILIRIILSKALNIYIFYAMICLYREIKARRKSSPETFH